MKGAWGSEMEDHRTDIRLKITRMCFDLGCSFYKISRHLEKRGKTALSDRARQYAERQMEDYRAYQDSLRQESQEPIGLQTETS
jgi:hypothetical protein